MEEIKKIYCGGCANHCLALVRINDGKVVEQFFEKADESLSQKLMHANILRRT